MYVVVKGDGNVTLDPLSRLVVDRNMSLSSIILLGYGNDSSIRYYQTHTNNILFNVYYYAVFNKIITINVIYLFIFPNINLEFIFCILIFLLN